MICYDVVFSESSIEILHGWEYPESKYDIVVYDKKYNEIFQNNEELFENAEEDEHYKDLEYHVKVFADATDRARILHIARMKLNIYLCEELFFDQDPEDDFWHQKKITQEL
jgi:hypothetical protein